jgi:hypothetical protein
MPLAVGAGATHLKSRQHMMFWLRLLLLCTFFTLFFFYRASQPHGGPNLFLVLIGAIGMLVCWRKADMPGHARAEQEGRE